MFGAQGLAQSRDFSWSAGTLCGAPIKVSYYVFIMFGFQVMQLMRRGGQADGSTLLFLLLEASGSQAILLLTVLCHEFGHGNMARYLGGQIDHILLWVFGGICFHTRPPADRDNAKILRNDFLVVAAGPSTHFLQAPLWGLALFAVFLARGSHLVVASGGAWEAFLESLNPLGGGAEVYRTGPQTMYMWAWMLAWRLVQQGIRLNVSLFIFNVFFPMYPADGAKLLVTSLMFFCGVPPRSAALVLVCTSVPCALLMIGYALVGLFSGGMMSAMMGWMGFMSLMEAKKIWDLRSAKQLHTHALFEVARSWQRSERDSMGRLTRINNTELDDDQVLVTRPAGLGGGWTCAGCITCMLPCVFRPSGDARAPHLDLGAPLSPQTTGAGPSAPPAQVRELRAQMLSGVDDRQQERQRTVRELQEMGAACASVEQSV